MREVILPCRAFIVESKRIAYDCVQNENIPIIAWSAFGNKILISKEDDVMVVNMEDISFDEID